MGAVSGFPLRRDGSVEPAPLLRESSAHRAPPRPRLRPSTPALFRLTRRRRPGMVAISRLFTPAELVHRLDDHVIDQSYAKKRLSMAVYRHSLGRRLELGGNPGFGPQHQLLLGPTGVGKSLLVKTISSMLRVPTAFTAATSLVETGYVGTPVESMFATLLDRAAGDQELAEHGIVFLDEFDKLRRAADVSRDVSGEGVQNGLLTLMDGRPVRLRHRDREVTLDSGSVLFLCTGAFAGLPAIVGRRLPPPRGAPAVPASAPRPPRARGGQSA